MKIYARVLAVLLTVAVALSTMPVYPTYASYNDVVVTGAENVDNSAGGSMVEQPLNDSSPETEQSAGVKAGNDISGSEVSEGDASDDASGRTESNNNQDAPPTADDSQSEEDSDFPDDGETPPVTPSDTVPPENSGQDPADPEAVTASVTVVFPVVKDGNAVFNFRYRLEYPADAEETKADDGTFQLYSGGNYTIEGLPEGTVYSVDLYAPDGYEFEQLNWNGCIGAFGDISIMPIVVKEPDDSSQVFIGGANDLTVSATASPETGLSKDAMLQVDAISEGTAFASAVNAISAGLGLSETDALYFMPYDIYFLDGESRVEPESGLVELTVTFNNGAPFVAEIAAAFDENGKPKKTEMFVAHIRSDGTVEKIVPQWTSDNEIKFAVSSFSVMGLALVVSEPETLSDLDGKYLNVYVPAIPEGVEDSVYADTLEEALAHLADGGTIWLTGDVALNVLALSGRNAVIRSYGDTPRLLTKNGDGENMFVLSDGASLTLENVVIDATGNILGRTITASGGSKLTLGVGAMLENNAAYGAVYLDGSTININGGTIRNNSTTTDEASTKTWAPAPPNWTNNTFRYYYDVDLGANQGLGGAVLMVNGSEFTISSGSVSGNNALCGGAVYAWGGSVITLSGGLVSDNTATGVDYTAAGGAIAVDNGTCAFTINGAEITGNSAKHGGAFWFGIDTGKLDFSMTSGSIRENTATDGSVAYFLGYDSQIDISGNESIIENNTASGNGAFYVGMYPGNTLSEQAFLTVRNGATFSKNHAAKGSCMYLTRDKGINGLLFDGAVFTNNATTSDGGVLRYGVPNSTFTVRNSTFTENKTDTNGGCFYVATDAEYSTFVFDGSTFNNNYAQKQGGVWRGFPPYSDITYTNCTFNGNTAELGDGGCFYCPGDGPESNVTIDGGSFTNNKSGSSGGAFRVNLNGGIVTVKGGALFQYNQADVNAGAFSIRRKGADYYGEAYLLECDILDNVCNADFSRYEESDKVPTEHYNTGGVYIGENITCYMQDALVTGNYVVSGYNGSTVGNGIGLCPNAQVFLYPEHGATIYGNGDNGGMDIVAVPYDEVIDHETPAMLYVSDVTPDGRPYNWTDLDNEEARTGMYDWTNIRSGIATAAAVDDGNTYTGEKTLDVVGFKANVADAGVAKIAASGDDGYKVRIIGNYTKSALYASGGVMVNGTVISGEFEISVEKKTDGLTDEEKKIKEFEFELSINGEYLSVGSYGDFTADFTEFSADNPLGKKTKVTFDDAGSSTVKYRFKLKSDEKVTFTNFKNNYSDPFDDRYNYYFELKEIDSGGAVKSEITWEAYSSDGMVGSSNKDSSFSGSTSPQIKELRFTCINTFEYGELDLTKTVEGPGNGKDKLFEFNINLTKDEDSPLSGTYQAELWENNALVPGTVEQGGITFTKGIGLLTFTEGNAKVRLKHGQTLKIRLPAGTTYTVTETKDNNYTVTESGNTNGTITKDGVAEAKFTNTRKTGNLTIKKTVVDTAGDLNKQFKFEITLNDNVDGNTTPISGEFNYTGDVTEQGDDSVDAGKITFTEGKATVYLKGGQSITINGLPVGATYDVAETADDNYTLTGSVNTHGDITDGKTVEVEFTNTRKTTGSLKISKTVSDDVGDLNKMFTFEITLKDGDTSFKGEFICNSNVTGPEGGSGTSGTVTFKDGKATVYLKGGQSITINGLPVGATYDVAETADDNYTLTGSVNTHGDITDGKTVEVEFTNTRKTTGSLKISKTVSDDVGDLNKMFTFEITLKDGDTSFKGEFICNSNVTGPEGGSGTSGTVTFKDGKATVSLKHGQSITINGLPVGATYTVEEVSDPNYETSYSGKISDKILDGETVEVVCTNKRKTGDLTIKKTVDDKVGVKDKSSFKFEITLKDGNTPINGEFSYTGDITEQGDDSVDAGKITFTEGKATVYLKHDQSITINGLPIGATYIVTETPDSNYETSSTGGTSTENPNETTGEIVEGEGATVNTVTFTNKRKTTGSLKISKTVKDDVGDLNKMFTFVITLTDRDAPITHTFEYEGNVTDQDGDSLNDGKITFTEGKATVYLKDGQSITIKDLPLGANYIVTETTDPNYDTSPSGGTTLGTITGEGTVELTFTNTRKMTGGLTISKTVFTDGHEDLKSDKAFTFEITLKDGDKPINGNFSCTGTVTGPGGNSVPADTITFTEGKATVSLKDGQSITINGLPAGATYTVVEKEANKDGYRTTVENGSGTIKADSTEQAEVKFTNTRYSVILPETGGPGSVPLLLFSLFSCVIGIITILFAGKHKSRGLRASSK